MCMVFCVCHVSIDMKPAILENVYPTSLHKITCKNYRMGNICRRYTLYPHNTSSYFNNNSIVNKYTLNDMHSFECETC